MVRNIQFLSLIFLLILVGCNKEPDEKDIEGWIRAGTFTKVNEYVASGDNPMEKRVRAMELLVEYGQMAALQHAIDQISADERKKYVPELLNRLIQNMTKGPEDLQPYAKNALFALMRYLPDKQQNEVLEAIAAWGFAGLSEKTPPQTLVETLQNRGMTGQLTELKTHGIQVACWLVSHGIDTQRLGSYLSATKEPALQRKILGAVRKLFSMKNLVVPWSILDAVRHFPLPETVDFLVDVYMNESFPDDARSSALAAAQVLLEEKEGKSSIANSPENRKQVLGALKKLMKSPLGTDRWDAAEMMLFVGGVEELASVLDGLDDKANTYVRFSMDDEEDEQPDFVITEMCTTRLKPKAALVRPVLEARLKSGDRVQKAIAILCLKVLGEPVSIDALKPLVKDGTSLETFFFHGDERNKRRGQIGSRKLKELTVGLLARNAIDGIKLMGKLRKNLEAKKIKKDEYSLRTNAAISVISIAGKAYTGAVEQAYKKKKARIDSEPGAGDSAK